MPTGEVGLRLCGTIRLKTLNWELNESCQIPTNFQEQKMLTDSQVAEFKANGFLNGGHVIGDAEVETLRDELTRVIEHQDTLERKPVRIVNLSGHDQSPVWQIVNIWEASDAYRKLMCNRKIVEEIAQLTGASQLRIWHDQIQYKPAQIGGVNMWHQDAPLWPII